MDSRQHHRRKVQTHLTLDPDLRERLEVFAAHAGWTLTTAVERLTAEAMDLRERAQEQVLRPRTGA